MKKKTNKTVQKRAILGELKDTLCQFPCFQNVDVIYCDKSSKQPPTIIVKVVFSESTRDKLDEMYKEFIETLSHETVRLMSEFTDSWYIQEFVSTQTLSNELTTIAFNEVYVSLEERTCTYHSVKLP